MELFRTVMLNVIVLVFFTTVLDLLLPNGSFRSYIKMAMGFFAVLTLLQPAIQLLQQDSLTSLQQSALQAEQMVLAAPEYTAGQIADYTAFYTTQAEQQYAAQTAKQVEALLLLTDYAVEEVQCAFAPAEDQPEERQMQITIQLTGDNEAEQQQVQTAISGYFGLDASQVQVTWTAEEEHGNDSTE